MTDPSMPQSPRPVAQVQLRVGAIPKELKKLDRWILWKYSYIEKTGKWTKTPHSALNGHKIDVTNFANGVSFMEVVKALKTLKLQKFDGIGFLLGQGIAGIDVDDCIDDDGNLNERGQHISKAYRATYAEVSPSGQGYKILINIGDDPKLAVVGKNTGDTEIYGGQRYFTVTGAVLPGHASVIAPMAEAFRHTAEEMGANRNPLPMERAKEAIGLDLKAARSLLDHLPFVWNGPYSEWLKTGMAMHHEFDGDAEALELWDEYSQRNIAQYQPGCCEDKWKTFGRPGKETFTMRTLLREAQAGGWRAPHTLQRAIDEFTPFDEPSVDVDDDGVVSDPISWWRQVSAERMLNALPEPKRWIWQGVLREGKVMVLAGSGGSSKSYLMLAASIQYTLGNSWGPFQIAENHTPGKVLLMYAEEDYHDAHERVHVMRHNFMLTDEQVKQVGDNLGILPLRGAHVNLARMDDIRNRGVEMTEQLTRLEARIESYGVKLVVMDPLAMFHTLEENDNVSIAALISGLDAMCMRQQCSLILVHHFGKVGVSRATEVNESNVRGASALVAHARTVAIMHRLREDEATEWGVPEEDHDRWVMWAIVKNNYGNSGQRSWFNIDPQTGAITPAANQLQKLNRTALLEAVRVERDIHAQTDIAEAEFTKAKKQREAETLRNGRIFALLMDAVKHGFLCKGIDAPTVLKLAGHKDITGNAAHHIHKYIRSEGLVDTDGKTNHSTAEWLDRHELLG